MTTAQLLQPAIEHLRSHRVVFEPGLTDAEIARVEAIYGFQFPPDFRLFLQTALPITAGFPNWRSESENELRHRYLEKPVRGILFDVEHNDFWPPAWESRPTDLGEAIAEAGPRLKEVPPVIPIRSHYFLPGEPCAEGNPVFSIRQTDITCVAPDLPSYLMSLFEPEGHAKVVSRSKRVIPFWTEVAHTSRVRVPNLAGPAVNGTEQEYADLCQLVKRAGFWAAAIPLSKGQGVTFDRREPASDRKIGAFWLARRDFGWLLCVRGPRLFLVPDAERIPQLCLTLLNELPDEKLNTERLPFWNFSVDGSIRRSFGLIALSQFTDSDDERERKLRAWEQLGWRGMSHGQMDEAWKTFEQRMESDVRGEFHTPFPATTWDISPIYLRGREHLDHTEADLTLKALSALQECTRPGEELLALDWNHPCYFFDPHGGVTDAHPSSWAVPILPNGDNYLFLAQDYRFGIIGNCVDMTICVFGQELLAAFRDRLPLIFVKPTWTVEERRVKVRQWTERGWQRLTVDEKDAVWERFDSQFDFFRRRGNLEFPCIAETTPSLTWAIALVAACGEAEIADLTLKVLAGLQKATRPGERLYALDSLHWYEHYTFDPHRLESAGRESWALPVYPDDNYVIVLAPDFRFGVIGDPLERTVCIFGQELLEAISADLPRVFGTVMRMNREAVSG
jgi:hypothetical protein